MDPTVRIAGASVSAAAMITKTEIAQGKPMVLKYGSVVKLRHMVAPAIVKPEPRMTCETP